MPSKKTARVQERRRVRMAPLRTRAKSSVSSARKLIESSEVEAAEKAITVAVVALDKAAQKGAIHKKNASRRKSRLMKQLESAKSD
ncbi:MAG: 30S ribosomal protein S20 [SAR202 cluster bacterium]|nr:30S ribosomal protein S20 [SAR202 cluster bacterium]